MKIAIVGDGKVGYTLAEQLSKEKHDVVIIDSDASVLEKSQELLDVMVMAGNGASMHVQRMAGVADCELLIAATSYDEVNLLCCITARKLGCPHTIARIRNPEYDEQLLALSEDLGLSMTINPERAAAEEISRLLQFPSFLKRDSFYKSNVEMVEVKISENSPLAGLSLNQLPALFKQTALICAVDRGGDIAIPSGSFVLKPEDKITIVAPAKDLVKLMKLLNIAQQKVHSVIIIGGGRITTYLARELLAGHISVKIFEERLDRCEVLAEALPDALIIHGDGTSQELLTAEGIETVDAVVTLTGMDEENIILSLYAKHMGVKTVITKVNQGSYARLFSSRGIDSVISPKQTTANLIVRYVRAMANAGEGSVQTLYRIVGGRVEASEFIINDSTRHLGEPLSRLPIKPDILLASINRGGKVIIPKGADALQKGDSVIVVTAADGKPILDFNDIFRD
ncbi:MAG: Trk system potassium transporter TrkA [Clostridia bacterium]|nr:Trk system potassium transporter TrkA [Clostridia bacterium]